MGTCSDAKYRNNERKFKGIIIWIDPNIDNYENKSYIQDLISNHSFNLSKYNNVEEAINYMKLLKFMEIKVIISGRFYLEFVKSFKNNILNMYNAPKIIVFTREVSNFYKKNVEYKNLENFYKYGGIKTTFIEVKQFLLYDSINSYNNNYIPIESHKNNEVQLTFEYIDNKIKLMLPMLYKTLISDTKNDNLNLYTNSLYNTYSPQNNHIRALLGSIISMENIPIEILSKYYARLYTIESNFYKNLNKGLGLNRINNYLPYIKVLYEGVKLKSLPLSNDSVLYRGSKISEHEIAKIKSYLKNKLPDLPSSIVFSKSFLSFAKERAIAESFLKNGKKINGLSKVLYILENDFNSGYNLSTHSDLEEISFFEGEKEVLFFPFSSFEIKALNNIYFENEIIYEIRLLYLGKYLKDIKNDDNITLNPYPIPDSEFKRQLIENGLIPKDIIINLNTSILYNVYKKYEEEMGDSGSDDGGVDDFAILAEPLPSNWE